MVEGWGALVANVICGAVGLSVFCISSVSVSFVAIIHEEMGCMDCWLAEPMDSARLIFAGHLIVRLFFWNGILKVGLLSGSILNIINVDSVGQ